MEKTTSKYHHLFELESDPVIEILDKMELDYSYFKAKTCLITGGARGIGEQVALTLGLLDCNVIIVDKLKKGQDVTDRINKNKGGKSIFVHADISERENIFKTIDLIEKEFGHVDILLNNAVHFTVNSFIDMAFEEWELHQKTNIEAIVLFTKLVLPGMLLRKSGTVINMLALEGMAFASAMSSSKMAMRSLMFSLSSEIPKGSGVSILAFAPGLVATPLVEDVFVKYCHKLGVDFEDYILKSKHNPGYDGLMPVEHCASAVIYSIFKAREYHGLVADPFLPLEKYGIIITADREKRPQQSDPTDNIPRLGQYINEITSLNQSIESKIEERVESLFQEKETVLELLGQIETKNKELELVRDELILANQKIEESSRHKETFFTNVTHEIRTPLNAILGFIDLLLDSNLDDEQKENLNAIQISGEKLLRLVNEVLDISKISAGKLKLEKEVFNLYSLIEDLERIHKTKAATKNTVLSAKVQDGLPQYLFGDAVRLHQILINLIGNAIKFTNEGEINIYVTRIWEYDEKVKLSFKVTDTGVGIPEKNQKNIFETFTQVEEKRDRDYGGSGLGLAIVKQLVSLNMGTIELQSASGKGTTFIVNIAYEKPKKKPENIKRKYRLEKNALKDCQILLAEDNAFNQLLEKKVLEKLGSHVTIAENGLQVLELLKKNTYDLILMDLQMPKMDGMEATKIIRSELNSNIPIIALTANAFRQELDECLAIGMDDFVTKPFKKEHLARTILKRISKTSTKK